jgi:hypothetical protein
MKETLTSSKGGRQVIKETASQLANRIANGPQSIYFTDDERIARAKRFKRNEAARARRDVYASLGMKRVRGNLGGIYYE